MKASRGGGGGEGKQTFTYFPLLSRMTKWEKELLPVMVFNAKLSTLGYSVLSAQAPEF